MARTPTGGKPGRPSAVDAETAKKMRKMMIDRLKPRFKAIIDAQADAAEGIVVQQQIKLPNGKVVQKYYKEKPDVQAAKILIEQAVGKAKETVEHSGEITHITEVVARLEAEDEDSRQDNKPNRSKK